MKAKDWGLFFLVGVIWGTSFLWIKIALEEVSPIVLVAFRTLFGTLGLGLVLVLNKEIAITWKTLKERLPVFIILGLTNIAIPWLLISWAEKFIDSGTAAILNGTVPLFTIFLSPIFVSDDKISAAKVIGLVVGFLGVVVLMSPGIQENPSSNLLGQAASLVGALFYSVSIIFSRNKTKGISSQTQSFLQLAVGTVAVWIFAFFIERPFTLPQAPITWLALAWLGVLGSSVGYIIYFHLLHKIGPTRTSMTTFIPPLIGMILGIIFLHEPFYWQALVGAVMILSGIAIVNLIKAKKQTAL